MRRSCLLLVLFLAAGLSACASTGYLRYRVSPDIEVIQVSPHAWVHVSYAEIPGFGRVGSNGLVFVVNNEALLFDTPFTDGQTKELVDWIRTKLGARVTGFVPNHSHGDCMGGLAWLHANGVASYADNRTIRLARAAGTPVPQHGFDGTLTLKLGMEEVVCRWFGAAHSPDNIVVWLPGESILFAGCMVKETAAQSIGNTVGADLVAWPGTVTRVAAAYRDARIVIPGHGAFGGTELLGHTIDLVRRSAPARH